MMVATRSPEDAHLADRLILNLRSMLASQPSTDTVFNPYTSDAALNNVEAYLRCLLSYPFSSDLLVGEAPGYAGCALTGIPFTSEHVINPSAHSFIAHLRPFVACSGSSTERTATMVCASLGDGERVPAF